MVLLWQMPIAWFTFWKSTWGTRMTPADVEAQERKKKKEKAQESGATAEQDTQPDDKAE